MINLILITHGLFALMIALWYFSILKLVKTSITIHNLPIILLIGLGLFITTWCAAFKQQFFIPTGILVGTIVFIINSVKIPNQPNPSLIRNFGMSLFCTMFWPEMIIVFWIASKYFKINEKPQH